MSHSLSIFRKQAESNSVWTILLACKVWMGHQPQLNLRGTLKKKKRKQSKQVQIFFQPIHCSSFSARRKAGNKDSNFGCYSKSCSIAIRKWINGRVPWSKCWSWSLSCRVTMPNHCFSRIFGQELCQKMSFASSFWVGETCLASLTLLFSHSAPSGTDWLAFYQKGAAYPGGRK